MNKLYLSLLLGFALYPAYLFSQDSKTFNAAPVEGGRVEACESITLAPGFSFRATERKNLSFSISPSACGPRQEMLSLSTKQNYTLCITPLDASTQVDITGSQITIDRDSRMTVAIQYFDGLGRPTQTVQRGITPSGQDLVSLQEYDALGRDWKKYLPTPVPGNNGAYASGIPDMASSTYNDSHPYSETFYEPSPLSRAEKQFGPGQHWREGDHSVKTAFLVNDQSDSLQCALYYPSNNALVRKGNYAGSQLYVTRMEDEDGNVSYEFKDKIGQVVLTRQMNQNVKHDTYYVYDDLGKLMYVLPPELSGKLTANGSWNIDQAGTESQALKDYGYLYRYDHRLRCTAKKLPGADWIYYVYDQADRPILTQDGEQRKKSEWSFSKYDGLGRIILTGVYTDSTSHESLCTQYRNIVVKESPSAGNFGYSNNTPPVVAADKVFTVNYYDDYEHLLKQEKYFRDSLNYVEKEGYGKRHTDPSCTSCASKGLLTGTRVKMLDGSGEIVTALYYDDKGRVIQKKSTNHLGGLDKEYYTYTFTGQPIRKLSEHNIPGKSALTELYAYSYDHAGRQKGTYHQLNDQPEVLLSANEYDPLGRLSKSYFHNTDNYTGFEYNIRSSATRIETVSPQAAFAEQLRYETAFTDGTPSYNGNISGMSWSNQEGYQEGYYNFSYDPLSRLTKASYMDGYMDFGSQYSYDKQGNLSYISRNGLHNKSGHYMELHSLRLAYNGNQLKSVQDAAGLGSYSGPYDFMDYAQSENEYQYNANGCIIQDLNKGITRIQYNYLSLPERMEIDHRSAHGITEYHYSAAGEKKRVRHSWDPVWMEIPISGGSPVTQTLVTDYIANKVYEDNSLKYILTDGGYIDQEGNYYYYVRDHLGNNRALLDASGTVLQKTDYYPFGLPIEERSGTPGVETYKYNGKEFDAMHGVCIYDYHARGYDAQLGRFMSIDPMAEKYYSISPYAYCANNPLKYVDPTGMDYYEFDEEGNYTKKTEAKGTHRMMTKSIDKKGNITYKFYDFNDPGVDAKAIDNGTINKVELLSDSKVEEMIDASGVKSSAARDSRWSYALKEGSRKMDYGVRGFRSGHLNNETFYIRENTAYNLGDIGNYLWGRGMAELGFDLGDARMGAHANNALFGRGQKTTLYDFGPGTYGAPSFWDSVGDQRAIVNGYSNSPIGKVMLEQLRLRNEKARAKWNENFKTSFSIY